MEAINLVLRNSNTQITLEFTPTQATDGHVQSMTVSALRTGTGTVNWSQCSLTVSIDGGSPTTMARANNVFTLLDYYFAPDSTHTLTYTLTYSSWPSPFNQASATSATVNCMPNANELLSSRSWYAPQSVTGGTTDINKVSGFGSVYTKYEFYIGSTRVKNTNWTNSDTEIYMRHNSIVSGYLLNTFTSPAGSVKLYASMKSDGSNASVKTYSGIYWQIPNYNYDDGTLTITPSSGDIYEGVTTVQHDPISFIRKYSAEPASSALYEVKGSTSYRIIPDDDCRFKIPEHSDDGQTVRLEYRFTDSRGKVQKFIKSDLTIRAYAKPTVYTARIERCDNQRAPGALSENFKIDIDIKNPNPLTVNNLKYKIGDAAEVELTSPPSIGTHATLTTVQLWSSIITNFSVNETATVSFQLTDSLWSNDYTAIIGRGFAYLQIGGGATKHGIGLGTISADEKLSIGLPTVITPIYYGQTALTDPALEIGGNLNVTGDYCQRGVQKFFGRTDSNLVFSNGDTWDGQNELTVNYATVGAAASDHTHSYANGLSWTEGTRSLQLTNNGVPFGSAVTIPGGGGIYTLETTGNQIRLKENGTPQTAITVPFATTASTLSGLTASIAHLNYTNGVTSNIQTQLNGKAASTHTHTKVQITDIDIPFHITSGTAVPTFQATEGDIYFRY